MSSKSLFSSPSCDICGKKIGSLSEDERHAFFSDSSSMLCFDCEPIEASRRPEIFKGLEEDDTIFIGGVGFHVEADKMFPFTRAHERTPQGSGRGLRLKTFPFTRAHERTHERTRTRGLSSYTYLNRIAKNHVIWQGAESAVCPKCGGWSDDYEGNVGVVYCDNCKGAGWVDVAIFLPAWILGLESGNE